jgi:hypothetical protein
MSDTDRARLARCLLVYLVYSAAFLSGLPLLFLLRAVEQSWSGNLLASSFLEEAAKGVLFLALALALGLAKGRFPSAASPELLPLVCIVGFAMTENLLFVLYAPTTAVYQRLLYAYPIHLNTGLLYTIVFVSAGTTTGSARPPVATVGGFSRASHAPRAPHAARGARLGRIVLPALAALVGVAYHFALNVLALVISGAAVYAVGAANLLVLALLFASLHHLRVERSLGYVGL